MAGKKDPFWKHALLIGDNGNFSCSFCGHQFRGGVSIARFKSHLAGVKCYGTKVCEKVPDGVKSKALEAIRASKKKDKKSVVVSPTNVVDEECAIISHHPSSSMSKEILCKQKDKCVVDRKLANFIFANGLRNSIMGSPSFIDFAQSLAEFGPGYEVPSPTRFYCDQFMNGELRKEVGQYIAQVMKPLAQTGCTLIVDTWGGDDHRNIRNTNLFVYTSKGVLLEETFQDEPPFYDVQEHLEEMKNEGDFEVEHVKQFIVGSEMSCYSFEQTNLLHLEQIIKNFDPEISTFTCASLEIERFIIDILCKNQWIANIYSLTRSIVEHIKEHKREYYQSKGYASFNRYNRASNFLMLQAVLKDENELKAGLHPPVGTISCDDGTYDDLSNNRIISCDDEFWRDGKELVQVLHPIFQIQNLVNGYMSTSGYLYEAFKRAKDKIDKCLHQNHDKYKLIWEEFEKCRRNTIKPIHKAAALLNPDYKFSEDLNEEEIQEGVAYMLKSVGVGKTNNESDSEDFLGSEEESDSVVVEEIESEERESVAVREERETLRTQIETYRAYRKTQRLSPFPPNTITVHPRIWWEKCDASLHVLRKYAIQILTQPCSQLLCSQYRLKSICCPYYYKLGVNTKLMEKYSRLETRDEEPIDLDKLSGSPEYVDLE